MAKTLQVISNQLKGVLIQNFLYTILTRKTVSVVTESERASTRIYTSVAPANTSANLRRLRKAEASSKRLTPALTEN